MPLEETNPRLEAIIMEVKTRMVTLYEGRVPRADELLVSEIERLRARLRELVAAVQAWRKDNCVYRKYLEEHKGVHWCWSCGASEDDDCAPDCIFTLAAEIDKELKDDDQPAPAER